MFMALSSQIVPIITHYIFLISALHFHRNVFPITLNMSSNIILSALMSAEKQSGLYPSLKQEVALGIILTILPVSRFVAIFAKENSNV